MKHLIVTTIFALCASPVFAQSPTGASVPAAASMSAHADFSDPAGAALGSARLTQLPHGVLIDLDLKGLSPGLHGIHIHQTGKCEGAAKFASAGGHFAGGGHDHGYQSAAGPHAGDLPNLIVPENGILKLQVFTGGVSLAEGGTSLFDADGSALVIHAKADDYRSQPAGDSGDRIACAVVEK